MPEAKQQLEHHLKESLEQQKILEQIITSVGGDTTQEKLGLPLPSYPVDMKAMMDKSMTKQEYELKRAEEDMILENAVYLNAIDPLSKNIQDEQNQAHWIKTILLICLHSYGQRYNQLLLLALLHSPYNNKRLRGDY